MVKNKQKKHDAIIVLCGGLEKDGTPNPWVIRRLEKTIELKNLTRYILIPGRATPHKPPQVDRFGFPIDESIVSANFLYKRGVPKQKIFLQRLSLDTIGDAFFTRLVLTDPMKLKNILVITSLHHMPRTQKVFSKVYSLKPANFKYSLSFLAVSDDGLNKNILDARKKKEKSHLAIFEKQTKDLKSVFDFHHWLFTKHGAYALGGKTWKIKKLEILNSY